jgi:hypothetical protein
LWFDEIVPAYWLVRHDILTAREHLNFSTLGAKPAAAQRASLFEAVNMIQLGAMPLAAFVKLHPEAKVTPEEVDTLKRYLAPWSSPPSQPGAKADAPGVSLTTVAPEFNGLPFDANFESWKPLSTTDRGDNGTFRFILGNDEAVKAAWAGNISPWPDGARFAKIAWQQEQGADGLVHPGKFVQVELMVKNAGKFRDAEGWGWGRWRGLELKPYGQDARFVTECAACHQPLEGNDYVYTLPLSTATVGLREALNQKAAALPRNLPHDPLGWGAITMYVDPVTHTTATLYGDDSAMKAVAAVRHAAGAPPYPAGAILALVTWAQREDPHWFGARIPDVPRSVEYLEVAASKEQSQYRRFAGTDLTEDRAVEAVGAQRINFLLGLAPVQLP